MARIGDTNFDKKMTFNLFIVSEFVPVRHLTGFPRLHHICIIRKLNIIENNV